MINKKATVKLLSLILSIITVFTSFYGTAYCSETEEKFENAQRIVYGDSTLGRKLEAYVITGTGNTKSVTPKSRTLLMTFAVHGFEDEYFRDGQALTDEAMALVKYFNKHTDELGSHKLIIIPCVNPDGVIDGKNNYRKGNTAFGRCTAEHIDINRDFGSFKGKESRSLRDYIKSVKPDIYIDVHGWLNETIGDKTLNGIVNKKLGIDGRIDNYPVQDGYVIDWVHKKLGIPATLVEYKAAEEISTSKDRKMITAVLNADFSVGQSGAVKFPSPVKWKNGSTSERVYNLSNLTEKLNTLKPEKAAMCYGKSGKAYIVAYKSGKKHCVGFVKYSGKVKKAPTASVSYTNGSTAEAVYADTACTKSIGKLAKKEKCKCLGKIDGMYLVLYNVDGTTKKKCGFVKYNGT